MYYRLKSQWGFRGWKNLPYAVIRKDGPDDDPVFYDQETFLDLLSLNGRENLEDGDFSPGGREAVRRLMEEDKLEVSGEPLAPLEKEQRYYVYPARCLRLAHWSITEKCNFKCRHCLVSSSGQGISLPISDCLHIMDEIRRCGIRRVDLTGGEPLIRPDFPELAGALTEKGLYMGVLYTNASLLTEQTLDMLDSFGQKPAFQLSFDGLGCHDWLRGVPGAEAAADRALKLLKKRGVPVTVSMCIHRKNRHTLTDTIRYLADMGVLGLRVNSLQNLGFWKQNKESYDLTMDELWQTYGGCIRDYFAMGMPLGLELDGFFHCDTGSTDYSVRYTMKNACREKLSVCPRCESVRSSIFIGADGTVAPCMGFYDTPYREKLPNVLRTGLGEITLKGACHDLFMTTVGDFLKDNPKCEACPEMLECLGGCMLEGMTQSPDGRGPDPRACYFHRHIGKDAVAAVADRAILDAGLEGRKEARQNQ